MNKQYVLFRKCFATALLYKSSVLVCLLFTILFVSCKKNNKVFSAENFTTNNDSTKIDGPEAMQLPRNWQTIGRGGMVASANRLATLAGVKILRKGGNAIDALLATQWALNVVEPQSSGIGGGSFILYYDAKTKKVTAFDGREEAPASASAKMFLQNNDKPIPFYPERVSGGLPVGVPGTLSVMDYAFKRFGSKKITFAETFSQAIDYAKYGIRVSARLSMLIKQNEERLQKVSQSAAIFFKNGKAYMAGEILIQKDLANTFALIAKQGIKPFYDGEITNDIVKTINHSEFAPAQMKKSDLRDYRTVERRVVSINYRGYSIFSFPPPSSGITLLQTLAILQHFPSKMLDQTTSLGIHLKLEAEKLAFADRYVNISDPDFANINPAQLLNSKYINKLVYKTSLYRSANAPLKGQSFSQEGNNTSHITIIDKEGNIVSCTSSIEMGFGSSLVVKGRGFLLNNELTDFEPYPNHINSPSGQRRTRRYSLNKEALETKGGKRPRSSMSPVIILKGDYKAALGSPGGSRIIGINASVLIALIDQKLDIQSAINQPRALQRNRKESELEYSLLQNSALVTELMKMGHRIAKPSLFNRVYGGVQGIVLEKNLFKGGADLRREGSAISVGE